MSTLLYTELTRKRKNAPPETSESKNPPGLKTYVDALAALVPAEVLALHAIAISAATETTATEDGEVTTLITNANLLIAAFWFCIAFSIFLYLVRQGRQNLDRWDIIRMLIPALAFVAWTMIQASTAFDAVLPRLNSDWREVSAAALAAVLVVVASTLCANIADKQEPPD